jgi:hypothetical protein
MLAIASYMIATRVVAPRFASPWLGRREREKAIERAEHLLADANLNNEDRFRLQRCLTSLRARASSRESWGGTVPERELVSEINRMWDARYREEESPENSGRY